MTTLVILIGKSLWNCKICIKFVICNYVGIKFIKIDAEIPIFL